MNNPIKQLNKKVAWAWFASSVIGAFLAAYGTNPTLIHIGQLLLAMSAGYMIFGIGIKEPPVSNDVSNQFRKNL
ncbi:hypothetical protein ACEUAI_20310 [Aeromonas veronii]|nr:hypothetical protein [Aeromonas veronii]